MFSCFINMIRLEFFITNHVPILRTRKTIARIISQNVCTPRSWSVDNQRAVVLRKMGSVGIWKQLRGIALWTCWIFLN